MLYMGDRGGMYEYSRERRCVESATGEVSQVRGLC